MIYVLGTSLKVEQLPLHDSLQYNIVSEKAKMTGVLRMGIRKSDVVRCYVQNDIDCKAVPAEASSKLVRFATDDELLKLLKGSSSDNNKAMEEHKESIKPEEVVPEKVEASVAEIADIQSTIDKTSPAEPVVEKPPEKVEPVAKDEVVEIEEVAPVIQTTQAMFGATEQNADLYETDALRKHIAALETTIKQKIACIEALRTQCNEIYDFAAAQVAEISAEYDEKLEQAEAACESLKAQLESAVSNSPLAEYEVYIQKCRGIVKSAFQLSSPLTSPAIVVAPGTPESTKPLYQSLAILAMSGFSGVIADFTGDIAFGNTLSNLSRMLITMDKGAQNVSSADFNNCYLDPNKSLVDYIRGTSQLPSIINTNFGKSKVITAGFYHDIALLAFDWDKFFHEVTAPNIANNQPVIVLLPTISSFVSRYLISYLATGVGSCVATSCAPSELFGTLHNLSAVPEKRVKVLAMNYVKSPAVDQQLSGTLNQKCAIKVFKANTFFFNSSPTREDFAADVSNNSGIWAAAFANVG